MKKLMLMIILAVGVLSMSGSSERKEVDRIEESLNGLKNSLDSLNTAWDVR